MDTFKDRSHSDVSDSLEKGSCPSHAETCQTCSAQPTRDRGRRSFAKRHWIPFVTIALIWLVFSYGQRALYGQPHRVWLWTDDKAGHPPPPPDEDVERCVSGTNWTTYYDQPPWAPEYPHGAEITFSLPLDSDALHLISRGMFQQGLVSIEQSSQVVDTVDVRVRAAYFKDKHLKHTTVCEIQRADREYGVGIFTPPVPPPSHHRRTNELEFYVTLTLPAGNEGPLSVKKLETRLSNYNINVTDLGGSVLFDQISLASTNGKLSVQSITSEVGEFSLVNGEIDGHFNARSSLDLHVANGRITPTVNLLHREGVDPPHLAIDAINGQIDVEISLTSEALTGGEFGVDAQLSHGNLGLTFIDSPVDSVLKCHAESTAGDIQVELDSAFEGTYSLENRLGPKLVSQHDVADPAERGRHRVVLVNEAHGRVHGELRWMEGDGSSSDIEGHVVVKSVLSPIKLVV